MVVPVATVLSDISVDPEGPEALASGSTCWVPREET